MSKIPNPPSSNYISHPNGGYRVRGMRRSAVTNRWIVLDEWGEVVLVCQDREDIPLRYRGTHEILEAHIDP